MKFIKDERIKVYENQYKAEAYNIMMVMAFIYIIVDMFPIDLGFFKENMVFILFMTGALYTSVRLTMKGLGSYSPIKGITPMMFSTIIAAMCSVFSGVIITVRNTSLYMDGQFSYGSLLIFLVFTVVMFSVLESMCLLIYFISKKREQKDIEE